MNVSTLSTGIRGRVLRVAALARTWTMSRIVVALLTIAAAAALSQAVASLVLPKGHPAMALALVASVHLGYVAYVRFMEKRRVAELDWEEAPRGVGVGSAVGGFLIMATVLIVAAFGAYSLGSYRGFGGFAAAGASALVAAYGEEIVFRGVLFRLIETVVGTWASLAISALLFGLIHVGNPGAGVWTTAAISIEAGILLAAAFVLTRSLWFPVGLHFGWNLVQGGILGFSVSGTSTRGLFETKVDGPPWLTGGDFGPEASVVAVVLCTAAATFLLILSSRRRLIMKPRWRRAD